MPFALVIIGLLMIVTGARGTHKEFGQLLVGDFTGPNNFTYWLVALGFVGALGYSETLKPFSRMFLALIIVGMVIRNGGFFDKLNEALNMGPAKIDPKPDTTSPTRAMASNDNEASDLDKALGTTNKIVDTVGKVASVAAKIFAFV